MAASRTQVRANFVLAQMFYQVACLPGGGGLFSFAARGLTLLVVVAQQVKKRADSAQCGTRLYWLRHLPIGMEI